MIGLCQKGSCRKLIGHTGKCDPWPTNCWSFLEEKDKKKSPKEVNENPEVHENA